MKSLINKKNKLILLALLMPLVNFSQETAAEAPTVFSNPLFNTLLALVILLLIIIAALSAVIKNLGDSDFMKQQQKNSGSGTAASLTILFSLMAFSSYSANSASHDWSVGGISPGTFYFMCAVILMEIVIIASLIGVIRRFTKPVGEVKKAVVKPKEKTIFDQLNDAVDVENEAEILMDHEYDGIRELDNNLPPWWKYGFYLTILIGIVYMIHYHGAKTGNLQAAEYKNEMKEAELAIAEFMKTSANNVDESSVKMLTSEADLAVGKDLFISTCAACHGKLGEGGVGPNMTDDYWVHGGSVKDIFKTVKYGWPDKGMKSWKEDLSPMQIAQVTSFIKTLRGTNPPNGKDKQGDLYVEEVVAADSTAVKSDSLKVVPPDSLKK